MATIGHGMVHPPMRVGAGIWRRTCVTGAPGPADGALWDWPTQWPDVTASYEPSINPGAAGPFLGAFARAGAVRGETHLTPQHHDIEIDHGGQFHAGRYFFMGNLVHVESAFGIRSARLGGRDPARAAEELLREAVSAGPESERAPSGGGAGGGAPVLKSWRASPRTRTIHSQDAPRRHLHTQDSEKRQDRQAPKPSDIEKARKEAVRVANERLRDLNPESWQAGNWKVTVTDETGLILFTIDGNEQSSAAASY
jgi:hypothetical protein